MSYSSAPPRPRRTAFCALAVAATFAALTVALPSASGSSPTPGTRPSSASSPAQPRAAASGTSIAPFYSASGAVSLSTNAAGSNAGPVDRAIQKPAGATVKAAFLMAAGTGISGYTPVDGDVTIDGQPVDFDESTAVDNSIGSGNIRADVTSMVAPIVDAAPAGDVSLSLDEPLNTGNVEGEILSVVFNDPTAGTNNSVTLLYGAQQTTGDTFNILLSSPVDKSDPDLVLNMALGISYGFQPNGQYSQVDVDGQRLTTSAGGQDDGVAENGALITAGGVGDSNANPPDPNATDEDPSCVDLAPRCDDELYNLVPLLSNGDTSITVDTLNPSNDDNIFFSSLEFRGTSATVGEGIVLSPVSDSLSVGSTHSSTATVQDDNGVPESGKTVTFTVTSGPNAGLSDTGVTDGSGQATFSYSSSLTGTDTVVASFVDSHGDTQTSNPTAVEWTSLSGPSVDAGSSVSGPVNTAINLVGTSSGTTSTTWSVPTGTPCTFADPSALATTITCTATGSYTATLTGTDGTDTVSDSTSVKVTDVGPPPGRTCFGQPVTIMGTGGDDTIVGTRGNDVIIGAGGDDTIDGHGGSDIICGGAGDDKIQGGPGGDLYVKGGGGNDTVRGGKGDDVVIGGLGDDVVRGGMGDDRLRGGPGNDRLVGNAGTNDLNGNAGVDTCGASADGTNTYTGCETTF